jgi:hypothetical protein
MRMRDRLAQRAYDAVASTITAVKTFTAAPVFNALPTGTAVSAGIVASTLSARDSGANLNAANFLPSVLTGSTSGGTTVMDGSKAVLIFQSGTLNHTVTLPTTFIFVGAPYKIINKSTGTITVNASGGSLVKSLAAGASAVFTCAVSTPTTPAHWDVV